MSRTPYKKVKTAEKDERDRDDIENVEIIFIKQLTDHVRKCTVNSHKKDIKSHIKERIPADKNVDTAKNGEEPEDDVALSKRFHPCTATAKGTAEEDGLTIINIMAKSVDHFYHHKSSLSYYHVIGQLLAKFWFKNDVIGLAIDLRSYGYHEILTNESKGSYT